MPSPGSPERGYKPVIGYLRNQERAEALAAELKRPPSLATLRSQPCESA